jgi:muramidase (phage lysozyme)
MLFNILKKYKFLLVVIATAFLIVFTASAISQAKSRHIDKSLGPVIERVMLGDSAIAADLPPTAKLSPGDIQWTLSKTILRTIAWAETGWQYGDDDSVYRTLFGGSLFTSFAKHPDTVVSAGGYHSSAAGSCQFMPDTWNGLRSRYNYWPLGDEFSPVAQDLGCLRLFAETGAFFALEKGTTVLHQKISVSDKAIKEAMNLSADTWCSLPGWDRKKCGNPPQPQKTLADTIATFNQELNRLQGF